MSLLRWLETEVMPRYLFERSEMYTIFHVMEPSEVGDLIIKIHKERPKTENVCRNFLKYRVKGEA